MKMYDATERCPKCGGMMSKRKWTPTAKTGAGPPLDLTVDYGNCRLVAECVACGFQDERAPLDAPQQEHPPQSRGGRTPGIS